MTDERVNPNETALSVEMAMAMVDKMQSIHGRRMPENEEEFTGMLGIAFVLGRASIAGWVS